MLFGIPIKKKDLDKWLMNLKKRILESKLNYRIKDSKKVEMDKFPEGLTTIYNFEGNQYAIPKDFDTVGLWYNKTMFDEAGLAYPDENWTWDDLYNAAKKLTKPDGSQYG